MENIDNFNFYGFKLYEKQKIVYFINLQHYLFILSFCFYKKYKQNYGVLKNCVLQKKKLKLYVLVIIRFQKIPLYT